MTAWLRAKGHQLNEKRIRRLLRLMGLEAIYQRPRLSVAAPGHRIYPYLLRGLQIARPSQVSLERHYIHPPAPRVCLSGRGHGLVFALRPELGSLGHARQ